MKTPKQLQAFNLCLILCFGMFFNANAQEKVDELYMLNGETKSGTVTSISDEVIKFKYTGEDLEYEIKKPEIQKIVFASGRTEVITETAQSPTMPASSAADRKNKLAVLPFDYVTNDPSIMVDPLKTQIQTYCANSFGENASILTVQDPMTTNAVLSKNNIAPESIKSIPPKDLAVVLGVEYIVYGAFNVMNKGAITSGSSVTTYKDKEDKNYNSSGRNSNSKGTAVTAGSSSTRINYDTHTSMSIYNDQGENIYTDEKTPFSGDPEGFKGSIDNLVKHSPFGSKHK